MGCSSCGKNNLGEKLGKCKDCIIASVISSVIFWLFWYHSIQLFGNTAGKYRGYIFLFLAIFVSLLFIAHILAYLNDRRKVTNISENKENTSL